MLHPDFSKTPTQKDALSLKSTFFSENKIKPCKQASNTVHHTRTTVHERCLTP